MIDGSGFVDPHESASSIRTMQECPREWWYRYIEARQRQDKPGVFPVGSAYHSAFEYLYQSYIDGKPLPEVATLCAVFQAELENQIDKSNVPIDWGKTSEQEALEKAGLAIDVFHRDHFRPHTVIAVEHDFRLAHPEHQRELVGRIDLVSSDVLDDGRKALDITDHKTGARKNAQLATEPGPQVGIYLAAATVIWPGYDVYRFKFQQLVLKKAPELHLFQVEQGNHGRESMESLAATIALGDIARGDPIGKTIFCRKRSWRCGGCGFRDHCAIDF